MNRDLDFDEMSLDGGERGFHVEEREFCLASKKGGRKVMEDGNEFITIIFGNSKQVKLIINIFFLFPFFQK